MQNERRRVFKIGRLGREAPENLLHGSSNGLTGDFTRESGRRVGVTPLTRRRQARARMPERPGKTEK
jgi:hypothetical protein